MPRPEQTERATPKRREEARKRGQIAKSPDLAGAAVFLAGVFVLHSLAPITFANISQSMQTILWRTHEHADFTFASVWMVYARALGATALMMGVLFGAALLSAVAVNVLQTGFLVSLTPLTPSFQKVNPATGLQRLFSKQVLVNLAKQLLKLSAVGVIIYTSVAANIDTFFTLGQMPGDQIVGFTGELIFGIGWKFGFLLVIIGLLDYAYERWQYEENLKMSKQEIRDEYRQSEGNPEVKGAVKRRQREFARRRMMAAVPKATVVVTNPTHFAVALEWDEMKMEAPVVTAKGADLVAKRIREIAKEHGVPIMENPPLARTLYAKVELDQAIPPNMYAAVAQVIAFVFKLKRKTIA
ncbi:MAG TPA: flagellar biosynthesis protein FlhB [Candidatus Baltobacteraceae bacterium]|jgi:flagellar biosynthetic protein FlhB|nr:flagellar biosynthesis protein FlhB [Candidatus Baltobacteraceae bacterium]